MPSKTIEDFAYQVRDYMRSVEVVEGKNKLEITGFSSYTEGGTTFTVNSDMSVTVDTNGVASSANARFVLQMPIKHLVNGEEYVISGTPNDIDGTKAYVGISDWDTTNYDDTTGEGAEFTMFNPASYPNARIYIYVKSGTTLSNKVFKPMICTLEEWNKSHTYEPYYVPVKDSMFKRSEQRVLGAKNLLLNEYPYDRTLQTVDCIYNDDGSITLNGNPAASFGCRITWGKLKLPIGDYIISCNPTSESEIAITPHGFKNGVDTNLGGTKTSKTLSITENYDYIGVELWVPKSTVPSIDNITFYPMIRLASDPDDTYARYAMTNSELTDVTEATIDYSHTASSTTPSHNADRTHCYKQGNNCVFSFWITNLTISSGSWLEVCRLNITPQKETIFIMGQDRITVYGRITTSGALEINTYQALSAGAIFGQCAFIAQ